jgi:hypothetical protein
MHEPERYFTREEADEILPEIERLLRLAQEALARVPPADLRPEAAFEPKQRRNGHVPAAPPTVKGGGGGSVADGLAQIMALIQRLGVVVKDLRAGLVDFPSLREGRLVYLCWRLGEPPHVAWWHEVRDGFAGRRPLD